MENLNTQTAELFEAVRRSDIRQIKRLLAANVSPTQCSENGQTALTIAAKTGNARVIQLLCLAATNRSRPAQIFLQTEAVSSDVSLLSALSKPHSAEVTLPTPGLTQQLISHSPSYNSDSLLSELPSALPTTAETPSKPASQSATPTRTQTVSKTVKQDSQPTTKPPAPKLSIKALERAVEQNDLKTVNALIKAGVDCRPRHWYDTPLLVIAAQKGYGDIVQALIDAGANVHIGYDQLPLHAAAANGYLNIVQRLLNSGAYIHAEIDGGRTALMEAAGGGHFLVTELLIARGANINASYRGETALMLAARGRHRPVYELLYPLVPPAGRVPFPESMENTWQLSLQVQ